MDLLHLSMVHAYLKTNEEDEEEERSALIQWSALQKETPNSN